MGGIFGVCSDIGCVTDLFFGIDYHSHLGTNQGGMAVHDGQRFSQAIHNIENSPFRTKFEADIAELKGHIGVGCISDSDPQPIIIHSRLGNLAIVTVGHIANAKELTETLMRDHKASFSELMDGRANTTELVSALICTQDSIPEGLIHVQNTIEGSITALVCVGGGIYAARDKLGRTPLSIGIKEAGHCVSLESFAYINLGYKPCYELGPGEIVFLESDGFSQVKAPSEDMRICAFLWTYYGYPTSDYEGVNVEQMRYRCGASLAEQDKDSGIYSQVDCVAGVPDSGTAHALGYANSSEIPFERPLIKYTPTWPRSFMPHDESLRSFIARMKLVPVNSLIDGRNLLFVEDSIVRGTQMRGITDFLYACGAKELHIRSACPPILFNCKYLSFTRAVSEIELIAMRAVYAIEGTEQGFDKAAYSQYGSRGYIEMVDKIREELELTSLVYHSLDGLLGSIGIDKCKLCTYCWTGKE